MKDDNTNKQNNTKHKNIEQNENNRYYTQNK